MPAYNAITDTTLLSLKRYGATTLVAGAGETLTTDVGKQVVGVPSKYQKIVEGVLVELSAGEKTTVDATTATTIIAARTLTSKTSGNYKITQSAVAGYTITLPAVERGLKFEFLLGTKASNAVTIAATSTHLYGTINQAGTPLQINGSTNILFAATNANIGDLVSLTGLDSSTWCVTATTTHATGITVS